MYARSVSTVIVALVELFNWNEVPEVVAYLSEVPLEPLVPLEPEEPLVPDVPELPLVPEVPDEPLVPDVPLDPEVPDVPEEPLVPEVPDEPLVPDVPEEPLVPDVPEEPLDPEVPLVHDEPEEPELAAAVFFLTVPSDAIIKTSFSVPVSTVPILSLFTCVVHSETEVISDPRINA